MSQPKKNSAPIIGIDLLGGDHHTPQHISETLKGLLSGITEPFRLLVFGTPSVIEELDIFKQKEKKSLPTSLISPFPVEEVIHMNEDPLVAIRKKRGASISIGMALLKEKKIDALVSTGNTGALIASAKRHLSTIEGITRAALITLLPTKKSPVAVIDVGANIECTSEHLLQFAKMGIAYQRSRGIQTPKVGLLNIGSEESKGSEKLKETYKLLQEYHDTLSAERSTFIGNVEGKEVFSGEVDVLVTDGFTGNIFLKTSEGISSFILETLREKQNKIPFAKPLLEQLEKELYATEYLGGLLCGVDGIVMKCHGDANPYAVMNGVKGAIYLARGGFLSKIKRALK
ncbi:MAG: phosphate acyltransferase PlsX [Simkania negevensis]|nr:phosphate acyltransferase PlsX [Simkania negevensis]